MKVESYVFKGHIVEEEVEWSLDELSQTCDTKTEWLIQLVEEGILEPRGCEHQWCFDGLSVKRISIVQRLQRDLGLNLAGAALALELLEANTRLRVRLAALESTDESGMSFHWGDKIS